MQTLSKLKPAFRKDGTITAGNAPGLNTAASAMIVADRAWSEKKGVKPIAKFVAYGVGAVEPGMFGLGPVLQSSRHSNVLAGRPQISSASKSTRHSQPLPSR